MTAPHKALVALGLAIAIWVVALAPRGLFSGDSGVKLAQSHALWTSGFSSRALPAPEIDPVGEFTGYGEFKRRVNGEWQGIYSLTFTAAAAPLVGAFGTSGLWILPLLGTLLLLAGTYVLARRIGCDRWWAVGICAVTVFATPVLLYSSQFTEHPLATGLVTWALVLVVPDREMASRRDFVAGVLVGFAATVRPECYLAIAAVGLALLVPPWASWPITLRRGALYAAGAVVVVIPYWLVNQWLSDSWDPLVTFQKGAAVSWNTVGLLLVGQTTAAVEGIFLAYALTIVTGALPAAWRRDLRVQVPATALLAVLVGLSAMVAINSASGATGLFTVTPIALVGVWAGGRTTVARRAWVGAVVLLVAVLSLNRSSDGGGLQLGSRLLMPVLPALLCLGGAHLQRLRQELPKRAVRALHLLAIAGLAVLTAIAMVRGMTVATRIIHDGGRAAQIASQVKPRVIVTTTWWQSQVLSPALFDGKIFLFVSDTTDLRRLLQEVGDRGVTEITIVDHKKTMLPLAAGNHAVRASGQTTMWFGTAKLYFQDVTIAPATR